MEALDNGANLLKEHRKQQGRRLLCSACLYPKCVVCKVAERQRAERNMVHNKPEFTCDPCRHRCKKAKNN